MEKKTYFAPEITSVCFHNERGYNLSLTSNIEMLYLDDGNSREEVESFSTHDRWGKDNGGFWL